MTDLPPIKRPHEWTHDGDKVLLLKCIDKDGTSYGGFKWPLTIGASVEAPDWTPVAECGGGLHGWPWGFAVGDGKDPDYSAHWLAFAADPAEVVNLGGKAKCKRAVIVASGTYLECHMAILNGQIAWTKHASRGAATNSGYGGAATNSGSRGAATNSGSRGAATNSGYGGAATNSGYGGAATVKGDRTVAVVTNDACRVECDSTGIAVACADTVYWTVHPGAVLAQRTSKGSFLLFADDWCWDDGETVLVDHGVIWRDWK